ncbi:hypothetical protein DV452_002443 [Geotrichum candidum]|nr:hypothetical protein DV452_002443 [Geotrichum candidum]KAI9213370.1 hypothetical protein DS838_001782 [Geotrichum bryndzae]
MVKPKKTKKPVIDASYEPPQACVYDWPLSFQQATTRPYQTVMPLIEDQIYTLDRFFSPKVCDDLVRWFSSYIPSEDGGTAPSSTSSKGKKKSAGTATDAAAGKSQLEFSTTEMPPRKDYAARVNDRAMAVDRVATRILWSILKPALLPENGEEEEEEEDEDGRQIRDIFQDCIGLNENLRVYRYRAGHYFGQHYDEAVHVSVEDLTTDPAKPRLSRGVTRWTMLVYLTGSDYGELSGGATRFYPEIGVPIGARSQGRLRQSSDGSKVLDVEVEKGTVLLHKHGEDCLLHEGALVTSGNKWILRSDLVFPTK